MLPIPVTAAMVLVLPSPGLIASSGAGSAEPHLAVGTQLPVLEGIYLTGVQARLPVAARGKIALIALGFTYESCYPIEADGLCRVFTTGVVLCFGEGRALQAKERQRSRHNPELGIM